MYRYTTIPSNVIPTLGFFLNIGGFSGEYLIYALDLWVAGFTFEVNSKSGLKSVNTHVKRVIPSSGKR
jgi:hypothetical protein